MYLQNYNQFLNDDTLKNTLQKEILKCMLFNACQWQNTLC